MDDIYVEITADLIESVYNKPSSNIVMRKAFELYKFDAFDLDSNYYIDEDNEIGYVCTKLENIEIDGQFVDSEAAMTEYSMEDELADYVVPGDESDVKKYFSEYEINTSLDVEDIAYSLLGEGYTLGKIVETLNDLGFDIA